MRKLEDLVDADIFENKECEYKLHLETSEDKVEKWAKTLVGYSNTCGGYILVGVSNKKDIVGIDGDELDRTKILVLKIINRHIFPHIHKYLFRFFRAEKVNIFSLFGRII